VITASAGDARQRLPVLVESEPLELNTSSPSLPSAIRPALALTAAEEVETIRRVLLEAATSTMEMGLVTGDDSFAPRRLLAGGCSASTQRVRLLDARMGWR
jgi:hypothetical protein